MVNYVCTLSQSEMEKYFEWIIVIVLQLTITFHNFVAVILGQKKNQGQVWKPKQEEKQGHEETFPTGRTGSPWRKTREKKGNPPIICYPCHSWGGDRWYLQRTTETNYWVEQVKEELQPSQRVDVLNISYKKARSSNSECASGEDYGRFSKLCF